MQRVSFLRLTAESSSMLNEEEAMRPRHKSYYSTQTVTQPYVAVALHPFHFAVYILDVFKRHLIRYLPWQNNHSSHLDELNQDDPITLIRTSSVDDPRLSFVPLIQ